MRRGTKLGLHRGTPYLSEKQTHFSHLVWNLLRNLLAIFHQYSGNGANDLIVYAGGGQQCAVYRDAGQIYGRYRRVSHIRSRGDHGGNESWMVDLHCRRMVDLDETDLAGLHQMLDRWIAQGAHSKNGVRPAVRKILVGGSIARAGKMKIGFVKTEMVGDPQEGLKLAAALWQRYCLTSQIGKLLHWRFQARQKLKRVVVQHRHNSRGRSGDNVGLSDRERGAAFFNQRKILHRAAGFKQLKSDPRIMPLHNRPEGSANYVALAGRRARRYRHVLHLGTLIEEVS